MGFVFHLSEAFPVTSARSRHGLSPVCLYHDMALIVQPLMSASLTSQLDFKCGPLDSTGMLRDLLGECYCCQNSRILKSILTIHVYYVLGLVLSALHFWLTEFS